MTGWSVTKMQCARLLVVTPGRDTHLVHPAPVSTW